MAELGAHEILDPGAGPSLVDEKAVGAAERVEPLAEPLEELVEAGTVGRRLACHGLRHGESILRAMRELAHQEADVRLAFLALRHLHSDGRDAVYAPLLVAGRLDMDV